MWRLTNIINQVENLKVEIEDLPDNEDLLKSISSIEDDLSEIEDDWKDLSREAEDHEEEKAELEAEIELLQNSKKELSAVIPRLFEREEVIKPIMLAAGIIADTVTANDVINAERVETLFEILRQNFAGFMWKKNTAYQVFYNGCKLGFHHD